MRGRKATVTLVMPGERIRDEEGRWSELGSHYVVPDAVAVAAGAGYTARSSIDRKRDLGVVLVPHGTPIDTEQMVLVEGAPDLPDGEYRVEHVTPLRKHIRCLVQRHRPGAS